MTNLTNHYAFIFEGDKLKHSAFIEKQIAPEYYLVQCIDTFTGVPNIAKVFHLMDMENWYIAINKEQAEQFKESYLKQETNIYKFNEKN